MGSFLVTCSVTRQVVTEGQPCVIVPLIESAGKGSCPKHGRIVPNARIAPSHPTIDSTDYWNVVGVMIRGTYDDYGLFELIDDADNLVEVKKFFKHIIPIGYVAKRDVSLEQFLFNTDNSSVEQQRERINKLDFYELNNLFDLVIEAMREELVVSTLHTVTDTKWSSVRVAVLHDNVPNDLIAARQKILSGEPWRKSFHRSADEIIAEVQDGFDDGVNLERFLFRAVRETEGPRCEIQLHDYALYLKLASQQNWDELKRQIELVQRVEEVILSMQDLFIPWIPVMYGSQDYGNEIGGLYAEIVANTHQLCKQWQEDQ